LVGRCGRDDIGVTALTAAALAAAAAVAAAGNVNTQPHNWMARIMWTGKECGYMWEVNVHY
jgi:Spy/CpxP family protein refolding chaperone